MGWFWADADSCGSSSQSSASIAKCPINHTKSQTSAVRPVGSKQANLPAVCPMKKRDNDDLNPLNNMPAFISSEKQPGQSLDLPTERTFSSIPRGESEGEGVWEYPSPQQMFNAMVRKGKGENIPEDAVESMVDVHNFLNEGAWLEILKWELPYIKQTKVEPRLAQFTGRPDDLSPKARMYLQLGKIWPESFNTEPPFDRHDWYVLRSNGQGGWNEVRYVIDYYGGPDDPHGMPTFFLDVRPALDNVNNAKDRFVHWAKPYWDKALGKDFKKDSED